MENKKEMIEVFNKAFNLSKKMLYILNMKLKEIDISYTQWKILDLLKIEKVPISQSKVSQMAMKRPASVVRNIDSLEKAKLVERKKCRQDRRVCLVKVTELGEEKHFQAKRIIENFISIVSVPFSEDDLTLFKNKLSIIEKRISGLRI